MQTETVGKVVNVLGDCGVLYVARDMASATTDRPYHCNTILVVFGPHPATDKNNHTHRETQRDRKEGGEPW